MSKVLSCFLTKATMPTNKNAARAISNKKATAGLIFVRSFPALRSLRGFGCRASLRRAAAARGYPAVSLVQNFHHSRNLRKPYQRPAPPNLARQCHRCIRAAEPASVAQEELHFAQQLL